MHTWVARRSSMRSRTLLWPARHAIGWQNARRGFYSREFAHRPCSTARWARCAGVHCLAVCCSLFCIVSLKHRSCVCVALCCSVLQRVAVCYSNVCIDLVAPLAELATQVCNVLHFVAACCSVLQQCVHRSCGAARAAGNTGVHFIAVCCASVQSIVVCCSLLQSVAVCCSLLQSVMHFPP